MKRYEPSANTRSEFNASFSKAELDEIFRERISRSRAVGRDGVRVRAFEAILERESELIRRKIARSDYKFTRYKEKLVSKGPGKLPRVLSIPTVRDRLTLRALCNFVGKIFRDAAIRKPHSYIKDIRKILQSAPNGFVFLRVDIKDYYGTIDQKILLKNIRRKLRLPEPLDLLSKAISTPTVSKEKSVKGVPQGLSISNILASIYLADCDARMRERWTYYRYVDDILIVCERERVDEAFAELKSHLKRKKLSWHDLDRCAGKSYIADVAEGVEYLGFDIRPSGISVRTSSFKRMFGTIASVLTEYRFRARPEKLIWRLNLKITGCRFEGKNYGWMFFFLQTDNIVQLSRLDNFVRLQLKKRGLSDLEKSVKRFVKSYHEIRFNLNDTTYIPDFDNYSIAQMQETIKLIRGDLQNLITLSEDEVKEIFYSTVGKEVSDLEKDLMESTS